MSTAVAKTIPIGPVMPYWNDVLLGSPMSQATMRHNKETIQAGLQEAGLNVISHKTLETLEIDVVIADFKLTQLRYVYDKSSGFDSSDVIDPNVYTATTTTVIRFKETHKLSGTVAVTVNRSTYDTSTIEVWKSDWSEKYTKSTDWTGTASEGTVGRLGTGSITNQDTVFVMYNEAVNVERLGLGGGLADFEAPLRLVHETDDGKALQFYFYRAKKIGASDIAIQMAAEFGGVPMTFHCLADMAQPEGKQLAHVVIEA